MLSTILAITWKLELHGIIITVIAVATLCGSVYLLLGTNLGVRLGLMVALAGLFGWIATMGFIWWAYGIGLKGVEPTWRAADVIVADGDLSAVGIGPVDPPQDPSERAAQNSESLTAEGWSRLAEDDPKRALAIAGADEIIQKEAQILAAGEYKSLNVYDMGGKRYPMLFGRKELDFFAFWHKPHYAIVEVATVVPVFEEPGRAPRPPVVDTSQQHMYVMMVRDLGERRKNSAMIAIGSTIVFGVLCWMLHARDRRVAANIARG
jgi:hypothetical protein